MNWIFVILSLVAAVAFCVGATPFNLETFTLDQAFLGFIILVLTALAGLGIKWWVERDPYSGLEITWKEYAAGIAGIGLFFAFLGVNIAWNIAWNSEVTFHEYWNGWELEAVEVATPCTRDGPCYHEYACDPYIVLEFYDCNCDDDGCDTCTRPVTKYHSCPYATVEYTYINRTTLGDYTIDNHIFAVNPEEWRGGEGMLQSVQRGPSQLWLDCKARVDAGRPGPVTVRMDYENYLLASDRTILNEYSSRIEEYKAEGLLPDPQFGIRDFYFADKVYFVGYHPTDPEAWQTAHSYLNAALGNELQGDLHLVLVQDDFVSGNPDAYITALKAYWQDPEVWEKDTISKNSIIVVIGTKDGETVAWARAITGMPLGNEYLINTIRSRFAQTNNVAFTPQSVVGIMEGEFYLKPDDDGSVDTDVRGVPVEPPGVLQDVLFGLSNPATQFARVSMTGEDTGDVGSGFTYLAREIKPSFEAQRMIVIIMFVLSLGAWWVLAYLN